MTNCVVRQKLVVILLLEKELRELRQEHPFSKAVAKSTLNEDSHAKAKKIVAKKILESTNTKITHTGR